MKQLYHFSLLLLALVLPAAAIAHDFEVDSIYYQINEGNVVTVVSRGEGNNPYSGDIVIPDCIDYDGVRYIVASIGDLAFSNCSSLTSITIPNSVTSIGDGAFAACSGLTSITIPNSVIDIGSNAFSYCSGLTSVTIGNSVTTIGYGAFCDCSSLTSITIPSSVTYISSFAFSDCTALKTLNYNAISCDLGIIVFPYNISTLNIGDSVQKIPAGLAYGFSLENITIPNSITYIGDYAFYYCDSLNDVYSYILDPTLITMGEDVFILSSENYDERILYVPFGSSALYHADNRWSKYFGSIVEMEPEAVLAEAIKLNVTAVGLNEGATLQLTATVLPEGATDKGVMWASSNPSVATVDSNGLVTTHSVGTATITAITTDGSNLSTSCTVTLLPVGVKGDVNGDSSISIADVTKLIDYLLSGSWD